MWINLETNKTYNNRLEAKNDLGSAYFNKLCRERKIIFLNSEIREKIINN